MTQHKVAPKWFGQGYGNYPGWDKAVAECTELLKSWARRGYVGTYKEVTQAVEAIPWPEGAFTHSGSQIGWLLGNVSVAEWLQDRPLLSALVVQADERVPGEGFFKLLYELGLLERRDEAADMDSWTAEVTRCHDYWQGDHGEGHEGP